MSLKLQESLIEIEIGTNKFNLVWSFLLLQFRVNVHCKQDKDNKEERKRDRFHRFPLDQWLENLIIMKPICILSYGQL